MEKIFVIKIGGNIIDNTEQLDAFLQQFSDVKEPKILIHGGGKLATELAASLNISQQLIEGRRITDAATLEVVTMVYAGSINKNIVAKLQANNCNALGLCGADANLIAADKRIVKNIDYGFVGDIKPDGINISFLKLLFQNNITAIIAPITHNNAGQLLNTNADSIANEIAKALSINFQVHLIYCFNKKGILKDVNDENSVIKTITNKTAVDLKLNGSINEGMIPKIDNALQAVAAGVHKVSLGHALALNEIVKGNAGTDIQQLF
jgi:acetylglutamate kinase